MERFLLSPACDRLFLPSAFAPLDASCLNMGIGFIPTWPWVIIQIVPVNIRFNPTTQIGSKMGGAPTNQNGTIGFDPSHITKS